MMMMMMMMIVILYSSLITKDHFYTSLLCYQDAKMTVKNYLFIYLFIYLCIYLFIFTLKLDSGSGCRIVFQIHKALLSLVIFKQKRSQSVAKQLSVLHLSI
jgi:hypothetical protein